MARINRFEDVDAWKAARKLVGLVYDAAEGRKLSRDLELKRQMISSARSAMANIAEGFDSGSDREFARFLRISQRSASELQSHLYVAADRRYVEPEAFQHLYSTANDVKKLVGGFIKHLQAPHARTKD